MPQSNDLSRSLAALDQDSTLIAVIEMSQSSWLVAGIVPGVNRQPLKKLAVKEGELLRLLQRWRDEATKAGRMINRITVAYEAGRDGFWLARWLQGQSIEAHVIHPTSVAVSREHRRAKTDRLDTELLKRAFLGWLRGERGHCSMALRHSDAAERWRSRTATERNLAQIAAAVARQRQPLRGKAEIGLAVGAVIDRHKMAKHFTLDITQTSFAFTRKSAQIAQEAALDGGYVVRTSLSAAALDDDATVKSYKSLSLVEPAFRCLKTVDLQIRPVYHWLEERVRAHVFLCLLAYDLEWHMRQRLAPMLYDDIDKEAAEALRASVVAKAERSPAAVAKQTTGRTGDGLPVHSFRTLIADLATLTRNTLVTAIAPEQPFTLTARPTPLQQKARHLLALSRTQ